MRNVFIQEIIVPSDWHRKQVETASLKESLLKVGLIQPIVITDTMELVSGLRRLKAYQELYNEGHTSFSRIPTVLNKEKNELKKQLLELHANIEIAPLNSIEQDYSLAKAKQIWLELHPDSGVGKASKYAQSSPPFSEVMAEKLDESQRNVQLAIRRAERSTPRVLEARKEGKISLSDVNSLVTLDPDVQDRVLTYVMQKAMPTYQMVKSIKNDGLDQTISRMTDDRPQYIFENIKSLLHKLSKQLKLLNDNEIYYDGPDAKELKRLFREIEAHLKLARRDRFKAHTHMNAPRPPEVLQ